MKADKSGVAMAPAREKRRNEMRTINTTRAITIILSLGLISYAVEASSNTAITASDYQSSNSAVPNTVLVANREVRGADWTPKRAITQNLPATRSRQPIRESYTERNEPDIFSEDEILYYDEHLGRFSTERPRTSGSTFQRDRYREREEPNVFSEDETLYYDDQDFAQDRFGYAKQRFKQAAQRYREAKRNFSREQRRFFFEYDRFQDEKEQYASASAGFAKTMLGTIQGRRGDTFMVENVDGRTERVHVGKDTLVDESLQQGDPIIAKVLPNGHAIALVKDRGKKGISVQPLRKN